MAIPSVLKKILHTKAEEITAGKAFVSHDALRAKARDLPPTRGFANAIDRALQTGPAIIAEVKKASPSAGVIREDFHPAEIARAYEQGGACCLSVLTDEQYFGGHRDYLGQAREACSLPALRKDFIVDPWQLEESRCLGADCVLLIVSALEPEQLQSLYGGATELGMDVLIEVHDEAEMELALTLGGGILGVNNRNLHHFTTDLQTSLRLHKMLPKGRILVTESGIRTRDDVQLMRDHDINAFLVGEAFMREPDPGLALRELFFDPPVLAS